MRNITRPALVILVTLLLIAVTLKLGDLRSSQISVQPEPEVELRCEDWVEPQFVTAVSTGTSFLDPINLPMRMPVTVDENGVTHGLPLPSEGSPAFQGMYQNIEQLVDSADAIFADSVRQDYMNGDFQFMPTEMPGDSAALFNVFVLPDGTRIPVIELNYILLTTATSVFDQARVQMSVFHEYQHYLQYQRAVELNNAEEVNTFLVQPYQDERVNTPAQCEMVWLHELEAYRYGCDYMRSTGLPLNQEDACSRMDNAEAFSWYLFRQMNQDECRAIHAQLAGHPHPEACAV